MSHRRTYTYRKHIHTSHTHHILHTAHKHKIHKLSHKYPHVHRTLHMYEHIHICWYILWCTNTPPTAYHTYIYQYTIHMHATPTPYIQTQHVTHRHIHITYNIYLHPHIQQITHMYTQRQYITYTYIPHICTFLPSHSYTEYHKHSTLSQSSEDTRNTQILQIKWTYYKNTNILNIAHMQTHNTLHMPQLYRHIPHICTYLHLLNYSYTNTKYTHAHSPSHTYHT